MRVYKVTMDVLRGGKGAGWQVEKYNVLAHGAGHAWSKVSDKPKAQKWVDDDGKKVVNPVKEIHFREAEIICELGQQGE